MELEGLIFFKNLKTPWIRPFFLKPLLLLQNTILQNITYNARLLYLQNNTYDTYNVGYLC